MNGRKHLTYNELLNLYSYISKGYNIEYISSLLGCNRSTIYRIIIKHRKFESGKNIFVSRCFKNCVNLNYCKNIKKIHFCPTSCKEYKKYICEKLTRFPYICDFCSKVNTCLKDKYKFNPEVAYINRIKELKESRTGPQVSKSSINSFSSLIVPLIKKGLSIESIEANFKESFIVSSRQLRNWIDNKVIDNLSRADLINAQKRDYKKEYKYIRPSGNPLIKVNRTYESYKEYMNETLNNDRFELDTVHGLISDKKCILTIHYPKYKFQFGFMLDSCSSECVNRKLMKIMDKIGKLNYIKMFKVYLADNGVEFDKLYLYEKDPETNEPIARVFYTRPYRSGDKGSCERNHELFRYFINKGNSLDNLNQKTLDFIFSNINSYPRKSLNYKTPYELMIKEFGETIINKLGIVKIEYKDLTLRRKIIK